MSDPVTLILPVPPSPNRWPSHPLARQREKNEYRKRCWAAAIVQAKPDRDPPCEVRVSATLYLCRLRDEDNASASLKWTLDALKQRQEADPWWRQGIADQCGWFVDDSPVHMSLGDVTQERVPKRKHERVEITVESLALNEDDAA